MPKIAVCVPTRGQMDVNFVQSLISLLATDYNGCRFEMILQTGTVIQANRENLVKEALEGGNDYILFLDDDMVFPPDAFVSLYDRKKDIVCVNYPKRAYPIAFVAKNEDGSEVLTLPESTGLVEVKFSGLGMALIKADVFKTLQEPYFPTVWKSEEKAYSSEDFNFFKNAKAAGFTGYVDQDASKLVGHSGNIIFHWRQRNG